MSIEQDCAFFESQLRSLCVQIPISQVVDIVYIPTGTYLQALVASPEFTKKEEGERVYVEGCSERGSLDLVKIPQDIAVKNLELANEDLAFYGRDRETRKIIRIYLCESDVDRAAYCGNLKDLLSDPRIARRQLDNVSSH